MKRNSQSGVALVITLVLLAMVTLMAVVFLSMGRRERASVKVSEDQLNAKLMADAATARAQAQVIANIKAANNMLNYHFFISTNFYNPAGFNRNQQGLNNPTNVSYTYSDGTLLKPADMLKNLGNLQYDPRPPVFIQTNAAGPTDFRFYLDFNRNRLFETNGLVPIIGTDGNFVKIDGASTTKLSEALFENAIGDPEWIGELEHPDQAHGENNRFVGRYAYLVLPAGKSLDLNFIHNQLDPKASQKLSAQQQPANGYMRNQGIGSWEINLAAFLRELNTNVYSWGPASYQYTPNVPNTSPKGVAFDDARELLSYRYNKDRNTLGPAPKFAEGRYFTNDFIDNYGDHFGIPLTLATENDVTRQWPGNLNTNSYFDVQDVFSIGQMVPPFSGEYTNFLTRLVGNLVGKKSSYDRYTYYRLLGQLGVDSVPAVSANQPRIHLNYTNNLVTLPSTNLMPWTSVTNVPLGSGRFPTFPVLGPSNFFYVTADAMLKSSVEVRFFTNSVGQRTTNFAIGDTPVRPDISITNIQIWHEPTNNFLLNNTSNEYTATIHRILQVAANIYDNMTNQGPRYPFYPSVFRPLFTRTTTNIIISAFTTETNATFASGMTNLDNLINRQPGDYPALFLGQPVVVGAKKGWPNFNEFSVENFVQVSRRLEVVKKQAGKPDIKQINQMYTLGISNIFGLEAWNSYTNSYTNKLWLSAQHRYSITLSNNPVVGPPIRITNIVGVNNVIITTNFWAGNTNFPKTFGDRATFMLPIEKGLVAVDNKAAIASNPFFREANIFETDEKFTIPTWVLYITNSVQYILTDNTANGGSNGKIVDFVNLDQLTTVLDITRAMGDQGAALSVSANAIAPGVMWQTNVAQITDYGKSVTSGITNQLAVAISQIGAKADPAIASQFLKDFSRDAVTGQDYQRAVNFFRVFRGLPEIPEFPHLTIAQLLEAKTELAHQVPFVPTRNIYQVRTWQANDPLVHYMVPDLFDARSAATNTHIINPPQTITAARNQYSNLGKPNYDRFKPWPSSISFKQPQVTDYDPAIKDPSITKSDDWHFPVDLAGTNYLRFPTIGWLGRVHRGTPWQTVYLKGVMADPVRTWYPWAGNLGSHPTNDWRFLGLFTTAPNENATRGLLSVNQTNTAAWSAVLSGLVLTTNITSDAALQQGAPPVYRDIIVQPGSLQISNIVRSINVMRTLRPTGLFTNLGEVLSAPGLSDLSPYLSPSAIQRQRAITEDMLEQIPTKILSLLKVDEPRVVIYSFGQSLKPAPHSLSTSAAYYNMCTNYQVTGEVVTKTVLRIEGSPFDPKQPLKTIVESFNVLPPIE